MQTNAVLRIHHYHHNDQPLKTLHKNVLHTMVLIGWLCACLICLGVLFPHHMHIELPWRHWRRGQFMGFPWSYSFYPFLLRSSPCTCNFYFRIRLDACVPVTNGGLMLLSTDSCQRSGLSFSLSWMGKLPCSGIAVLCKPALEVSDSLPKTATIFD